MSSRLYGDWQSVQPKIKATAPVLTKGLVDAVYKAGEEYIQKVKDHIDNQDLGMFPLMLATILKKQDHKEDWWVETGKFKDKLSINKYYKGMKTTSIIAGAIGRNKYKQNVTMYQLASWLEYGTKNIVGRPLFTMTLMEMKPEEILKNVEGKIELIWNSPIMFVR